MKQSLKIAFAVQTTVVLFCATLAYVQSREATRQRIEAMVQTEIAEKSVAMATDEAERAERAAAEARVAENEALEYRQRAQDAKALLAKCSKKK